MSDLFDQPATPSSFNSDYASAKFDTQSNIAQDIVGGTVATVVDIGATLWNSLPATEEVSTRDLLSNISTDAMNMYDAHPDAIAVASFIGGSLAGGGLALKGMSMLRTGAKGATWFSDAGKAANMVKVEEAVREGQAGTQALRALRTTMLRDGIVNNVIDAAAMETVMLGTMNAHPMLENYWDDPVKNMGISLLFGGVLGGGIGHIVTSGEINRFRSVAEEAATTTALKAAPAVDLAQPALGKIMAYNSNIKSLEKIVDPTYKTDTLTREIATNYLSEQKAAQNALFLKAAPDMEALDVTVRDTILKDILNTPAIAGGNKIKFLTQSESALETTLSSKSILSKVSSVFEPVKNFVKDIKGQPTKVLDSIDDVVYLPKFKAYVSVDAAPNVLHAADTGITKAEIIAEARGSSIGAIANKDVSLGTFTDNSASIDRAYLVALHKVDSMGDKEFRAMKVDYTDAPVLNAILARGYKDPSNMHKFSVEVLGSNNAKATWDIKTVETALMKNKSDTINNMVSKGMGLETISIRTNTPIDTVRALVTSLPKGSAIEEVMKLGKDFNPISYGVADNLDTYLAQETRALRIGSSIHQDAYLTRRAQGASNLDQSTTVNINTEFTQAILDSSTSTIAQTLNHSFFGGTVDTMGMRPMLDMLSSGIGEMVNSKLGNAFFESSDFFLRNTATGRIVTGIGKKLQKIASDSIETMNTPIVAQMSKVMKDPIDVIEFNLAININAGLKGVRIWRDGSFWQMEIVTVEEGGLLVKKEIEKQVLYNGSPFIVKSPEVSKLMDILRESGKEMRNLTNTGNAIIGKAPLSDIGFWTIPFNPRDKQIAFVWDTVTNTSKLLHGKNDEELAIAISAYKAAFRPSATTRIITKTPQEMNEWNMLHARTDPLTMEVANIEMQHSGASQQAIVSTNTDIFNDIISGYQNKIESNVKRLGQYIMHDSIDALDKMSHYNRALSDSQPLGVVAKGTHKVADGAITVRNTLLGGNNLGEYVTWKGYNEHFEQVANWGIQHATDVLRASGGVIGKSNKMDAAYIASVDFEKVSKELAARGIPNEMWGAFDDAAAKLFGVASVQEVQGVSKRLVYASNAFAATYALRFLDIASPLVNAMSVPILTGLAKMQNMPEKVLGAARANIKIPGTVSILYDGARLSNSIHGERLGKIWEKEGYFTSMISEANDNMRASRSFGAKGLTPLLEKSVDNDFVNMMSKPADWTETMLRRQMMYTGAALGKKMYPTLGDDGVTLFARDFMDRSMGNYHSAQRPVFFQGTAGVAMGLFQTYMLTLGQNIYRSLELKDYKTIGKAMLTQSTIFGGSSMPGFDIVSTAIGDHFSDDNYDLTTGSYRAVGDATATAILYGLPSSLGPAVYTRGDISPRFAMPAGDFTKLAAVNMLGQTAAFAGNILNTVKDNGGDVTSAVAQAFSLQSVSRPLARVSELVNGYSVTQKGNTVSTPTEVYTFTGVASRILGARPTQEAKMREAEHFNTVYGQLDRANRQSVTKELKSAARNNTLTNELQEKLANNYMRKGGTPTGWQGAVNEAIAGVKMSSGDKLEEKMHDNNPLHYMIGDM